MAASDRKGVLTLEQHNKIAPNNDGIKARVGNIKRAIKLKAEVLVWRDGERTRKDAVAVVLTDVQIQLCVLN
eukprot:scaffold9817_cov98-Skeletonema_dohrnii-CCMP3373.AAC.3